MLIARPDENPQNSSRSLAAAFLIGKLRNSSSLPLKRTRTLVCESTDEDCVTREISGSGFIGNVGHTRVGEIGGVAHCHT